MLVHSPIGLLRLDYAFNPEGHARFHFGLASQT